MKPDQLIKRRGKLGLLKVNATIDEVQNWVQEKIKDDVTVCSVCFFLSLSYEWLKYRFHKLSIFTMWLKIIIHRLGRQLASSRALLSSHSSNTIRFDVLVLPYFVFIFNFLTWEHYQLTFNYYLLFFSQDEEMYVCIYSHREGDTILFHHEGGIDIGDVDAKVRSVFFEIYIY